MHVLAKLTLLLIILTASLTVSGSDNEDLSLMSPVIIDYTSRISGEIFTSRIQAHGTQYLFDSWLEGKLYLIDGSGIEGEMYKYNAFLDELIWLQTNTYIPVQTDKELIKGFELYAPSGDTLFFDHITIKPWFENQRLRLYAQRLYTGAEVSLLAQRRIRRTGEIHESSGARIIATPTLEADPLYFVLVDGEEARDLRKLNRRSLIAVFPDHKREVRSLIRSTGIRINTESDMIRVMQQIDSMFVDDKN